MSEYISVNQNVIEALPHISDEALRVFLVLLHRNHTQGETRLGLTLNELARAADVSFNRTREALAYLSDSDEGRIPYIKIAPKGKHHVLVVNEYWIGDNQTLIPFTYNDTDDTKLAKTEAELRRLAHEAKSNKRGQSSGLVEVLKGEERDLVQEIEGRRGYGLDQREAYHVGKAVSRFGPDRVKKALRQLHNSKDPIRAAYAALMNGMQGKGAQTVESQPFVRVKYRDLDEE